MKIFIYILFAFLFFVSPAFAGEVIVVAPYVFYPNGYTEIDCPSAGAELCENRKSCENLAGDYTTNLLSTLGGLVYVQLGNGLNRFNESIEARRAGTAYRVKALASPVCSNNLRVKTFYRSLAEPDFLSGVLHKYKADMIVWGDFQSRKVRNCGKKMTCTVPVKVGWQTLSAQGEAVFNLEYESMRKGFSTASLNSMMNGLRQTYAEALLVTQ